MPCGWLRKQPAPDGAAGGSLRSCCRPRRAAADSTSSARAASCCSTPTGPPRAQTARCCFSGLEFWGPDSGAAVARCTRCDVQPVTCYFRQEPRQRQAGRRARVARRAEAARVRVPLLHDRHDRGEGTVLRARRPARPARSPKAIDFLRKGCYGGPNTPRAARPSTCPGVR